MTAHSSTVNDVELYALRDLIASHIACEEDCMALPTGCGCALTAARAVLNRHAQCKLDPQAIQAILEDEVYCDRFEGTYDYGEAVSRIMTLALPSTPSGTEPSGLDHPPDWKQDQAETSRLPRKPEARYIKRDREFIERGLSDAINSADPALAADARRALDAFLGAKP